MNRQTRVFQVKPAARERTATIVAITGGSGTGKTFSAFRLATGFQRVIGGKIGLVDTEARRGLHYVDKFKIDCYVDFEPPFGPLDYKDAIAQVIAEGAKIVIVDQLTHEHSGEGGVMDQINAFLDEKCGDDWKARERMNMIAHARIKPQRKVFNNWITQLGRTGVVLILLYRGRDVIKPMTKGEKAEAKSKGEEAGLKDLGVQPETTSPLIWETTIGFLLKPGADGRPTILSKAETDEEKTIAKTPEQFRSWDLGKQLDESLGERLAWWSLGSVDGSPIKKVDLDARAKAIAHFAALGIDEARVLAAAGGGDVVALGRQWAKDIKAGRKLEDIFPPPAAPAAEATREPGDDDTAGGALTAAELEEMQREDEGGRP